jgi:hypothetical protein
VARATPALSMARVFLRIVDDDGTCLDILGSVAEVDVNIDREYPWTFGVLGNRQRMWTDLHIEIDQYWVSQPVDPVDWEGQQDQLPPEQLRIGPGNAAGNTE